MENTSGLFFFIWGLFSSCIYLPPSLYQHAGLLLRTPLAARNAPEPAPAASADIARRLERFKKRLGAMNTKPVPDRQERVRRESFVERGDLQKRAAAIDLRLRFRPSDEDLRRANICHFHRQWHL